MAKVSQIEWTDATWSPLRVRVRKDAASIAQNRRHPIRLSTPFFLAVTRDCSKLRNCRRSGKSCNVGNSLPR